jgi:hypothetical protein
MRNSCIAPLAISRSTIRLRHPFAAELSLITLANAIVFPSGDQLAFPSYEN